MLLDQTDQIGQVVRDLRQLRHISVRSLAKAIGRSPAFVSQMERNFSTPSLKDIYAIAGALDAPVGYFLQDVPQGPEEEQGHILRIENRRRMEVNGIISEFLSPKIGEGVDFNQTTYLPLAKTEIRRFSRPCIETGLVLSGQLEMFFEGQEFHLSEGDSYSLHIDKDHNSRNPSGEKPTVLIWSWTYR